MKPSLFSNPALEQINFQTDGFGKDIEEILTRIRENYKKPEEIYDSKEKKELDKLIQKRTGILVNVEFNTVYDCCVDVPTITRNHIFINNAFREYYDTNAAVGLIEKVKKHKLHNTVDLKRVKVTGIFADLPTTVFISGEEFLHKTLTTAEYTAILLHEIGHLFVSYEFINRTNTTNQVLAAVCKTMVDKSDGNVKEMVFKEASDILNAKTDVITSLSKSNDPVVVSTVILKSGVDDAKSELGIQQYDATSFEMLADNFASRFGYGRELITALDTIHKGTFLSIEKGRVSYFTVFMLESIALFVRSAAAAVFFILGVMTGGVGNILLGILNAFLVYLMINYGGADSADYTYDVLKVRYKRIREQFVERLKDKKLSTKEIKDSLESISVADKIIDDTFVYAGPISIISNFLFSSNRKVLTSIDIQRQLEEFSANSFFIKAAELKVI